MDIHFTPEEQAFRDEVRAFLTSDLPADTVQRLVMLTHLFGDDDFHLGGYSALLDVPRQAQPQQAH